MRWEHENGSNCSNCSTSWTSPLTQINLFFNGNISNHISSPSSSVCSSVEDQTDPTRSRLVRIHILSLSCHKYCSTSETQTDEPEEEGVWPCLTSSLLCFLYAECRGRVFISAAECLCNWRVRWSSSNQGRIIKTCWSLQSWEKGQIY